MYLFKIVLRNIFKQKLDNAIIITSLAIGITCISLIAVFIMKELKTDSFHVDKEDIYAITCDNYWDESGKLYNWMFRAPMYITEKYPEIEERCLFVYDYAIKIKTNNKIFDDDFPIIKATDNFFSFFSYQLIDNNPQNVLKSNNSIVISEKVALKFFGTTDAMNKIISIETYEGVEDMVVSGVFKLPLENSHLQFEMVRLLHDEHLDFHQGYSYIRLKDGTSAKELQAKLDANKETFPRVASNVGVLNYYIKPIKEIYFDSDYWRYRDRNDLWIASFIGVLILLIALFNYLGITSSKLTTRIKSYKIQRINGSTNLRFILNFLFENLILITLSLFFSQLLIIKGLPFFNQITGSQISVNYIYYFPQFLFQAILIAFLLLITLLFVLKRISTETTFSSLSSGNKNQVKQFKIPMFSIFQLAGTVLLIICSIVVLKQIYYISNKPVGFDKNAYRIHFISSKRGNQVAVFKNELLRNAIIESVSIGRSPLDVALYKTSYKRDGEVIDFVPNILTSDHDFIKTSGIKIINGDDVIDGSQATNQCLVNESFLKLFPDENLIGKKLPIISDFPDYNNKTIVGVVEDFHFSNLKSRINPLIIFIEEDTTTNQLLVKTTNNDTESTKIINQIWSSIDPDAKLVIEKLGDRFEEIHQENTSFIKLISSCCFISIFLSMIGLFAISIQDTLKRTKEIGIRKANGAKISEIITLLNKDFITWSLTAIFIATPIAWYAMHKWLENFAYKTELSWWIFALAGLLALGIALLTVSWQSWRAATRNPVEALRYE